MPWTVAHSSADCSAMPISACQLKTLCVVQSEDTVAELLQHVLALLYRTFRLKARYYESLWVRCFLLCCSPVCVTGHIQDGGTK